MIRVELRNEYGLGAPELYKNEAAIGDDPKALLDGVAVSGLVGILRQLGDLAEFAAEVFYGLQEQVTITSSRSHKLMIRVQHIEAALPSLEKAVLAQKSHLHFAYTAGSYWHPRIHCEKHHFIYSDLPRFIMDSYEECHGPPRLDLLDKFDPGGPGSCLKRYSDPTFFRRTSSGSDGASGKKQSKDKKSRRNKKRRSWRKNGEVSRGASSASFSGRMHFGPLHVDGKTSPSQSLSANDVTTKLGQPDQSNSFDLKKGSGYNVDYVFHNQPEEQYLEESSSPFVKHHDSCLDYAFLNENDEIIYESNNITHDHSGIDDHIKWIEDAYKEDNDYVPNSLLEEQTIPVSSYATWDEKVDADIGNRAMQDCCHDQIMETFPGNFGVDSLEREDVNFETTAFGVNFETKASESVDQSATNYINHGGKFKTISMNLEAETERAPSSFEVNEDHGDFQLRNGHVNARTISDDLPEDIESETENFVDALNTIDSESETDLDYQSKQEGKKSSNLNKTAIEDDMDGIQLQLSDSHASSFDLYKQEQERPLYFTKEAVDHMDVNCLQLSGSYAYSFDIDTATNCQETLEYSTNPRESTSQLVTDSNFDKATSRNQSNSITLEHPANSHSPEMASGQLTVASPLDGNCYGSSDVHGGLSVESLVRNSSSSACREESSIGVASGKISSNPPESQKPPPEPSVVTSVQFWTNGSLLGLEPSKPPDFSVSNAGGQVIVATREKTSYVACHCQDGQDSDVLHKSSQDVPHMSRSNCSTSYQDEDECGFSRWKIARRLPSADLDVGKQKLSDYQTRNGTFLNVGRGNSSMLPANDQSKVSETDRSSFRMFEIGSRLLANGFHRRLSFDRDENPNSISALDTGSYEQNSRQSIAHRSFSGRSKAFSRGTSPIMSPSSSPPLGHMKISFQPVDGFETSKLRLKFPNDNNGHENSKDVFPSFQLVPEPGIRLHDINLNSDEDIFCGSSPYTSDDCLSHQSEPNSELWESGESPAIKDHELYDALCRISLTESISTSLVTGGTTQGDIHGHCDLQSSFAENEIGRSQSAHYFDLPSLDTLNPSFKQHFSDNSNCKSLVKSYSLKEPTPPPPPLPPMEWRATKQHLVEEEERQHYVPEAPSYLFDLKLSKSITSQQPKPAPLQQDQIVEAVHRLKSKQQVGESVQKETNQAANGKGMGEKEDFLHQIRTKSFNLRRTATTKPAAQTGLPTSVKVTAILERANAIRQAVGSDDGDDDENWSDN